MTIPEEAAIEAMARAIAVAHAADPDQQGPATRYAVEEDGVTRIICGHVGPLWKLFEPDARAAYRALREMDVSFVQGRYMTVPSDGPSMGVTSATLAATAADPASYQPKGEG